MKPIMSANTVSQDPDVIVLIKAFCNAMREHITPYIKKLLQEYLPKQFQLTTLYGLLFFALCLLTPF
jgi:hypothetical protein